MDELYSLLVITLLSGPLAGEELRLPYPTFDDCRTAIVRVTDTLLYDYTVGCERVTEYEVGGD